MLLPQRSLSSSCSRHGCRDFLDGPGPRWLAKVIKRLVKLQLIDPQTQDTLQELRDVRNRLAHSSTEYLRLGEDVLFDLEQKAGTISNSIIQRLQEISRGDNP